MLTAEVGVEGLEGRQATLCPEGLEGGLPSSSPSPTFLRSTVTQAGHLPMALWACAQGCARAAPLTLPSLRLAQGMGFQGLYQLQEAGSAGTWVCIPAPGYMTVGRLLNFSFKTG